MSLIQRLSVCFVFLCVLIGLQGAMSWWQSNQLRKTTVTIASTELLSERVHQLQQEMLSVRRAYDSVLQFVNPTQTASAKSSFIDASQTLSVQLAELSETAPQELSDAVKTVGAQLSHWVELLEGSVIDQSATEIVAPHSITIAQQSVEAELVMLIEYAAKRAGTALSEARAGALRASQWSLALLILALTLGGTFGFLAVRSLQRQLGGDITEVVRVSNAVARGDLTTPINTSRAAKDSVLMATVSMQQALTHTVEQVRAMCSELSAEADTAASRSVELSQRTDEQARSLEKTAATMEQLGSTVTQTAKNTLTVHNLTEQATETTGMGRQRVGETVSKINEINESANTITGIVNVIDDIAFQTNILALNAAVEAARAGEAGRGFAVVASEVRNLAKRSATSANEIETLIGGSVEHIKQGSDLADHAGRSMEEVSEDINRVAKLVNDVHQGSEEQRVAVAHIGETISLMDIATQENAQLARESVKSSQALLQTTSQLNQAVSFFKLPE